MYKPAISRGFCLALLASVAALAQTVAAGARAVVTSDTLPVYASMSETAEVKATLVKGDTVIIGLVLFGENTTWCALTRVGQSRRLGFASCEFLEPDRGPTAAVEAAPAPPPVAKSKPKPVTIREVAQAPITVREVPSPTLPAPVDPPTPKLAAAPAPGGEPAPAAPSPVTAVVPEPARATPLPTPAAVREPEPTLAPVPDPAPAEPPPAPATVRKPEPIPAPVPDPEPATLPAPTAVRDPEPSPPPSAPVPVSEPASISQSDFIEVLLDGSGLRSSLANYTQRTNLLSFVDKGRLAEIELPGLQRVLSRWFQPAAFYASIGGQVSKNYSPDRLPEVLEWLRSPITTKLASLERRALSADSREELVAFADGLRAMPPSQPRLVLIHRLYDSLRTCDMEVETTIALVHTVAQGISPALPKEKRYTSEELDRALGAVKSRYRSIMKNARIVHYLFAFRSAPDAELEQYISFIESDNGKWLISLVDKGFFDATESISLGLRTDIPLNVKPKRRLPGENTAKGLLP